MTATSSLRVVDFAPAPTVARDIYMVYAWNEWELFIERALPSFDEALILYRRLMAFYTRATIGMANASACARGEHMPDGLTDEEARKVYGGRR